MNYLEKNKIEATEIPISELNRKNINNNIDDIKQGFLNRMKKDYIKIISFALCSQITIGIYSENLEQNEKMNNLYLQKNQKESFIFLNKRNEIFKENDVLKIFYNYTFDSENQLITRVVHTYYFKNLKNFEALEYVNNVEDLITLLKEPTIEIEILNNPKEIENKNPIMIIDNQEHIIYNYDSQIISNNQSIEIEKNLQYLSLYVTIFLILSSIMKLIKYNLTSEEKIKTEAYLRVQLKELHYILKIKKNSKTGVDKETLLELQKLGFISQNYVFLDIIPIDILNYISYLSNITKESYNNLISDDYEPSELTKIKKFK